MAALKSYEPLSTATAASNDVGALNTSSGCSQSLSVVNAQPGIFEVLTPLQCSDGEAGPSAAAPIPILSLPSPAVAVPDENSFRMAARDSQSGLGLSVRSDASSSTAQLALESADGQDDPTCSDWFRHADEPLENDWKRP